MASDRTEVEEIIWAWIRSDACGLGLKMRLDRQSLEPLMQAIVGALTEERARGVVQVAALTERVAVLEAERDVAKTRASDLLVAFHAAIRRPMGVVPAEGERFYDARLADGALGDRP